MSKAAYKMKHSEIQSPPDMRLPYIITESAGAYFDSITAALDATQLMLHNYFDIQNELSGHMSHLLQKEASIVAKACTRSDLKDIASLQQKAVQQWFDSCLVETQRLSDILCKNCCKSLRLPEWKQTCLLME